LDDLQMASEAKTFSKPYKISQRNKLSVVRTTLHFACCVCFGKDHHNLMSNGQLLFIYEQLPVLFKTGICGQSRVVYKPHN